jgi:transposase
MVCGRESAWLLPPRWPVRRVSPEVPHDHARTARGDSSPDVGEHWKVGTIAAALDVHHDTRRAAIAHDTRALPRGRCRPTQLDRYLPFVRETLVQYPRLRATRLFEMVRARGYPGSVVQLRRVVRTLRPVGTPTLYRRLTTLPAEEAQIDWGAFGTIRIGHGIRPLSGFVMVLSYSRAVSALFTLDQTLESFLRGHVDAFHGLFAGVADPGLRQPSQCGP